MSHHIYKTEAIVISSRDYGENNKIFSLFTPDLGLISAHAQGIRKVTSKMRGHLFDLNHTSVALVRGREFWRVTGAESSGLYDQVVLDKKNREVLLGVVSLINRMILGEGDHLLIFAEVKDAMRFLSLGSLNKTEQRAFENIFSLRLLDHAGYIDTKDNFEEIVSFSEWNSDILDLFWKKEDMVISNIENALSHSHL